MTRRSSREAYFDNAKFIIGCLVIVGHAFDDLELSHEAEVLATVGASFRMPTFAFLVGYFSQGFLRSTGRARRLIAKIAIAYLLFDLLYQILNSLLTGKDFAFTPLTPYAHLWFLAAMLAWRGTAPLWWQMRHPFAVAVFISLASGFAELGAFTRFLSMLPFFVLGLMIKREHLALLRRTPVRIAAVVFLVTEATLFYFLIPDYIRSKGIFNTIWKNSYDKIGFIAPVGVGIRALVILGTLVAGAAVLSLITERSGWISRLGSRSLYMYVLHYAFIEVADRFGWYDHLPAGNARALIVAVLCFALGAVLCSRPTQVVFHRLMEPPTDWLFHPRKPRPKPRHAAPPPPAPEPGEIPANLTR